MRLQKIIIWLERFFYIILFSCNWGGEKTVLGVEDTKTGIIVMPVLYRSLVRIKASTAEKRDE